MEATEILQALFAADPASDPYPRYADLLATGEVCHPSQWSSVVVFGYAAVESVLRDPVFEVQGDTGLETSFPAWREHPSMSKNSVIDLNGGEHTRVRGLMSRAFSHRRVESLAPAIAATTASLLDDIASRGNGGEPVDFVAHFAFLLPVIVICNLVGIPQADRETFRPLAANLIAGLIGERRREHRTRSRSRTTRLSGRTTTSPPSPASAARIPATTCSASSCKFRTSATSRLSDAELHDNLRTLVMAGFLTTTHLLSNGLALLLSNPHLAAAMREAEIAVSDFVEETLLRSAQSR